MLQFSLETIWLLLHCYLYVLFDLVSLSVVWHQGGIGSLPRKSHPLSAIDRRCAREKDKEPYNCPPIPDLREACMDIDFSSQASESGVTTIARGPENPGAARTACEDTRPEARG